MYENNITFNNNNKKQKKNQKNPTDRTVPKCKLKIYEHSRAILLMTIWMIAHFPGLVQAIQLKGGRVSIWNETYLHLS